MGLGDEVVEWEYRFKRINLLYPKLIDFTVVWGQTKKKMKTLTKIGRWV